MTAVRAVLFDFNGTLSDDEAILYEVYAEMLAERGRPLTRAEYLGRLVGLSDEELFATWLGAGQPELAPLVAERVARYRSRVSDGTTIAEPVRAAVRLAAAQVPVGVVSAAAAQEIAPVVRAAGLEGVLSFVVSADDVVAGKPDPECYRRALALLGGGVRAGEVVVFEDTAPGIAAAKAAGMRVVALVGTLGADRLRAADELADAIEPGLIRRLLAAG